MVAGILLDYFLINRFVPLEFIVMYIPMFTDLCYDYYHSCSWM